VEPALKEVDGNAAAHESSSLALAQDKACFRQLDNHMLPADLLHCPWDHDDGAAVVNDQVTKGQSLEIQAGKGIVGPGAGHVAAHAGPGKSSERNRFFIQRMPHQDLYEPVGEVYMVDHVGQSGLIQFTGLIKVLEQFSMPEQGWNNMLGFNRF